MVIREFFIPVWVTIEGEREQGLPRKSIEDCERILDKRFKLADRECFIVKVVEEKVKDYKPKERKRAKRKATNSKDGTT